MDEPRLMYQEFKNKDEDFVTLMTQFLPTFEAKQPQDDIPREIAYFNDPEDLSELDMDKKFEKDFNEEKLNFYFVVDRSGSMMHPESKINTTK